MYKTLPHRKYKNSIYNMHKVEQLKINTKKINKTYFKNDKLIRHKNV